MPPWCGLDFFFCKEGKARQQERGKERETGRGKRQMEKKQRVTTLDLKGADFLAQGFRACLGSSLMST